AGFLCWCLARKNCRRWRFDLARDRCQRSAVLKAESQRVIVVTPLTFRTALHFEGALAANDSPARSILAAKSAIVRVSPSFRAMAGCQPSSSLARVMFG